MRFRAMPALVAGVLAVASTAAVSQTAPTPAAEQLPPIEVIQKQPTPAPAAKKKSAAKKKQAPVSPSPQPPASVAERDPATQIPNSVYGAAGSAGAAERAYESAATPVNPQQLTPTNLQSFSSSATNVTPQQLTERQPRNLNEALTRVPGVIVINDDGAGHHGGIGMRGSPARRSRKMLVMEDGHTSNLALWLDPSVHYWAPADRIESLEVIRGTIITHGPNNNFGVINARNLSPFGPDETVVSAAMGWTQLRGGCAGEGGDQICKGDSTEESYRWHVHTRQHAENVGLVLSYTGADVQGVWDTERLRFHDFHGALGWKGVDDDLTVSVTYARQRDNYDEQNFLGEVEGDVTASSEEEAAEIFAAQNRSAAEQAFFAVGNCKSCYAPASHLNTYNGDIWRGQIVHNAYLDDDTTVTSRVYAGEHRRDRYQLITPGSDPDGLGGLAPEQESDGYLFGEDTMFGRLRTFRHLGGEIRTEWANRQLFGFNQDIQAGIRYEYQDMTNRNFLGTNGQILDDGDESGATLFDRSLKANTVSAFLQTNIAVASDFNVLPGIRFEWYEISRQNRVIAEEESEAEGADAGDCIAAGFGPDCLAIEGINFDPDRPSERYSNFNALPGIAFAYTGLYRSTVFGGYHRGMSTGVLRNEDFPAPDEIGDNFNLGFRSSAIKGFDYEVAGFYQLIQDYQFGSSFSDAGDRSYGRAKEVEISGVELAGRLNSHPFTGGPLNFFAESNYTYARGTFTDAPAFDEDGNVVGSFNGNRLPEVPFHVAALTLGVEGRTGWRWNASATWTYRGSFYTDEGNTGYGVYEAECELENAPDEYECEIEEAGEDGQVPSIWLLSARFNMDIGDTGASVFVAGDNLLDKLYISDREDGMKPGLGRTVWTGFKYKF
jgi:Fe(3+) dicitrate transport protein